MDFLLNFIIFLRKLSIRILLNEYPNALLKPSEISNSKEGEIINLISSTNNFWVSKSMFKKWSYFSNLKKIDLNIYSNQQVNKFMKDNFKDDLIYEIYQKSTLPVQKIDLFRICCVYLHGGIWLDLKSEIKLDKVIDIYENNKKNGILLWEPRKIEVINFSENMHTISKKNVIHNGFFALPQGSIFLEKLLFKIKEDYLYFQDIVFNSPKQGIMNLTGPHQFTRSFYNMQKSERPSLVSHEDVGWGFYSKFGEFLSPFNMVKHYSSLTRLKTINSSKKINLE